MNKSPVALPAFGAYIAQEEAQTVKMLALKIIGIGKEYRPDEHERGEWRDEDGVCIEYPSGYRACFYASEVSMQDKAQTVHDCAYPYCVVHPVKQSELEALIASKPVIDYANHRFNDVHALEAWAVKAAEMLATDAQKEPIFTLSGYQLREALEFLAPDGTDEQLAQEVCIQHGPERTHDEGTDPAGLYCWLEEYPEEGAIALTGEPQQTTTQAQQVAVPQEWHLVGYYHKADDPDECDFYFLDSVNGDCPDCHPCYADTNALEQPPRAERVPMTDKEVRPIVQRVLRFHNILDGVIEADISHAIEKAIKGS